MSKGVKNIDPLYCTKILNYTGRTFMIISVNHILLTKKKVYSILKQLNYSTFIDRFNGGIDTLLIP